MTKSSENVRRMVLCAMFTALVAVCSQIAVPMPWGVPINLALFAVYMAGTMLGPVWGTASQVVFIALAAIGVPVLANFQAARLPSSADRRLRHRLHSDRAADGPADEGAGPQVLVALRGDGRGLCRLLRAGHDLVHDPEPGLTSSAPLLVRPALPARRRRKNRPCRRADHAAGQAAEGLTGLRL